MFSQNMIYFILFAEDYNILTSFSSFSAVFKNMRIIFLNLQRFIMQYYYKSEIIL